MYGYVENVNRWLDLLGLDKILYRIMGDTEAGIFESTGIITGSGGETTFTTDPAYYDATRTKKKKVEYTGTKYSITITDEAYAQLQAIGLKDNSTATSALDMPNPKRCKGWMKTNVRFKGELGYINIQVGSKDGAGLKIINDPQNRVSAMNMETQKTIDLHSNH